MGDSPICFFLTLNLNPSVNYWPQIREFCIFTENKSLSVIWPMWEKIVEVFVPNKNEQRIEG